MKRITEDNRHPKTAAHEALPSGRCVRIDRDDYEDRIIVHVGEDRENGRWRSETLKVYPFPFFVRPLAERIRRTIIELDQPFDPAPPDEVARAVNAALFHGGPVEETYYGGRSDPPLIPRLPPDPPSV